MLPAFPLAEPIHFFSPLLPFKTDGQGPGMEFEVKIPGGALVTGEVDERGEKGGGWG